MFRWLILLGTLALWLLCMALVYNHTRPPPLAETIPGMQAGLDVLFAEDAEPQRLWRIFIDVERLKAASQPGANPKSEIRNPQSA
ncbi:MAG: hypothetical protein NTW87_27085 [Planctomycetota bacterium]|nr:hypothetical protein [Planctomycetota bacterium]